MDINKIIIIIQDKIKNNFFIEKIKIEDKTFLHKKHSSHTEGKFHIKLFIQSKQLAKLNKIEASKKIYKILDFELKNYIHSIQILIS